MSNELVIRLGIAGISLFVIGLQLAAGAWGRRQPPLHADGAVNLPPG